MFLIDDLVQIPMDLTRKILEGMLQKIDDEMLNNETAVHRKYLEVIQDHENGQMDDGEYRQTVAFLSERLKAIKSEVKDIGDE